MKWCWHHRTSTNTICHLHGAVYYELIVISIFVSIALARMFSSLKYLNRFDLIQMYPLLVIMFETLMVVLLQWIFLHFVSELFALTRPASCLTSPVRIRTDHDLLRDVNVIQYRFHLSFCAQIDSFYKTCRIRLSLDWQCWHVLYQASRMRQELQDVLVYLFVRRCRLFL